MEPKEDISEIFESKGTKSISVKRWVYFIISAVFLGSLAIVIYFWPVISGNVNLPEVKTNTVSPAIPVPPPPPPAKKKKALNVWIYQKGSRQRSIPFKPVRSYSPAPVPVKEDIPDEIFYDDLYVPNEKETGQGKIAGSILDKKLLQKGPKLQAKRVEKPKVIKTVEPIVPNVGFKTSRFITIELDVTADIYGRVTAVKLVKGNPYFNQCAIDAVRKRVYEPYILSGVPHPVIFREEVILETQ